jgi:hypothetical protein
MTFQAMTWASQQTTGSPSAKAVLYALANHADFNGRCWPSQKLLAEHTEQSVDSVARRLKELETRRLIYRPPQPRISKGKKTGGSWTSGLIIVLLDDICLREALNFGYDPDAAPGQNDENEDAALCEDESAENQGFDESAAPHIADRVESGINETNDLAEGQDAHRTADCGSVKSGRRTADCGSDRSALLRYGIVNSENNSPLKSPPPSPAAALEDGGWLAEWKQLFEAWPWAMGELVDRVRRKFRELTPGERQGVLVAATAYLADCAAKKRQPMRARSFVGDGGWRSWELAAKGVRVKAVGEHVFVVKGTPAWDAWAAAKGKRPEKMFAYQSTVHGGKWGAGYPTLWPPSAARPAEGRGDDGGDGLTI